MDNPLGDMPQLPPNFREKLDQLERLLNDLQRDLAGISIDPVDDTPLLPGRPRLNQYDLTDILNALRDRDYPFGNRRSGLRIEGVEMTQSIQFYNLYGQGSKADSDNMVPLVAGKDLILRAYVERRPNSFFAPPTHFDGVVRYRGKELKSLNGPQPVQEASALRRTYLNDSLNFRIPAADCHGSITFTIRVSDTQSSTSPFLNSFNTAVYTITADFHEIPHMRITGVLVHFTGNNLNLPAPGGLDLVDTMARFLPMLPIPGYDYNVCTIMDFGEDLTIRTSWDNLLNAIANQRSASTVRTFYVGLLPTNTTGLTGASLRGIGRSGVAISAKDDTRSLSHELGHACGLKHVNENGPEAPYEDNYPTYGSFPFGSIGEEGIDTARLVLYHPTSSFDFMTYNENGPPQLFTSTTWISPYLYKKMMYDIRSTNGTADFPAAMSSTSTRAILLNFRVYRDGRVEMLPSYPVTGLPYVRDSRPELGVMLDLYDRNGAVIGSYRCHVHNPYQDADGAYLDFHEVLPWPEGVGEIAFVRDRQELTRLPIGETALDMRLEGVRRLEHEGHGDLARVEWSAAEKSAPEGEMGQTAALVRYSHDGGRTWQSVAADLREARCLVNLDLLPGGEECRFQVIVSSGLSAAVLDSELFVVRRKPRQAHIVSPQNGQTFRAGEPVVFAGGGHSPDFGTSASDEVAWSSSQQCELGTGSYLVRDDLPPGSHRITLSTPDGQGGETSVSVWIKVVEAAAPGARQA